MFYASFCFLEVRQCSFQLLVIVQTWKQAQGSISSSIKHYQMDSIEDVLIWYSSIDIPLLDFQCIMPAPSFDFIESRQFLRRVAVIYTLWGFSTPAQTLRSPLGNCYWIRPGTSTEIFTLPNRFYVCLWCKASKLFVNFIQFSNSCLKQLPLRLLLSFVSLWSEDLLSLLDTDSVCKEIHPDLGHFLWPIAISFGKRFSPVLSNFALRNPSIVYDSPSSQNTDRSNCLTRKLFWTIFLGHSPVQMFICTYLGWCETSPLLIR